MSTGGFIVVYVAKVTTGSSPEHCIKEGKDKVLNSSVNYLNCEVESTKIIIELRMEILHDYKFFSNLELIKEARPS